MDSLSSSRPLKSHRSQVLPSKYAIVKKMKNLRILEAPSSDFDAPFTYVFKVIRRNVSVTIRQKAMVPAKTLFKIRMSFGTPQLEYLLFDMATPIMFPSIAMLRMIPPVLTIPEVRFM